MQLGRHFERSGRADANPGLNPHVSSRTLTTGNLHKSNHSLHSPEKAQKASFRHILVDFDHHLLNRNDILQVLRSETWLYRTWWLSRKWRSSAKVLALNQRDVLQRIISHVYRSLDLRQQVLQSCYDAQNNLHIELLRTDAKKRKTVQLHPDRSPLLLLQSDRVLVTQCKAPARPADSLGRPRYHS